MLYIVPSVGDIYMTRLFSSVKVMNRNAPGLIALSCVIVISVSTMTQYSSWVNFLFDIAFFMIIINRFIVSSETVV